MATPRKVSVISAEPLLVKRQTTERALDAGETTVVGFEHRGWLTPIRMPGIRGVWHSWDEVKILADRLKRGDIEG